MTNPRDLERALAALPWLDVHTHIDASHLAARGLDDILLYHMALSELYAAGAPCGARLSENRTTEEAHLRLQQAIPYLPKTKNTFMAWGTRIIMQDLYEWNDPITEDNWRLLDARIRERSEDPQWARQILRKAGIVHSATELWRGRDGSADDMFDYSLQWGYFSRVKWGRHDNALYELERAWSQTEPDAPLPIAFNIDEAPPLPKTIGNIEDAHEAIAHYARLIPYDRVFSTATHFSTDIDYSPVTETLMSDALRRRHVAGPQQRDAYASYITHHLLEELSKPGHDIAFQFTFGAEPMPLETASRITQRAIAQIGELISRYPKVRFVCLLASRHANQAMCTLARQLPNLALAGYWWHNFYPGAIEQTIEERLDMLPINKQIGFFSDAYNAEWAYAKAVLVRKLLAQVLARKIDIGQYTEDDAIAVARALVYDTPIETLGVARNLPKADAA